MLAVSVAVCAHAGFLTMLLWQTASRELPSIQPLDVQLIRTSTAPRLRPANLAAVRPLSPRAPRTRATAVEPPPDALPRAPGAVADLNPAPAPAIGSALRTRLGCGLSGAVGLSPEERWRCDERFAAHRGDLSQRMYAAVAPAQQARFDANAKRALWWQEPFLATAPKYGCRPAVTNQQSAVPGGRGSKSDWRVSMGCAVSF
jgi:hypothetical protein